MRAGLGVVASLTISAQASLAVARQANGTTAPAATSQEFGAYFISRAAEFAAAGNWTGLEQYGRRVLGHLETLLGPHDTDFAPLLAVVAYALAQQGRMSDAQIYVERVRSATAPGQTLGIDFAGKLVEVRARLAALDAAGRWGEAEPLARAAYETLEAMAGPRHPLTGLSAGQLASTLRSLGRFSEAEPLARLQLENLEAAPARNDADIRVSKIALANILADQGKCAEADSLLRELVQSRPAGPISQWDAILLNNFAQNLNCLGLGGEMVDLQRRALATIEGSAFETPELRFRTLTNLGGALEIQGFYVEAEGLHRRALEISESTWGPDHPSVAIALRFLANNLDLQDRLAEANSLHARALAINEATFGIDNLLTADSMARLGVNWVRQGRLSGLEPLFTRSLQIRRQFLGDAHPETAESAQMLSMLYLVDGSPNLALAPARIALDGSRELGWRESRSMGQRAQLQRGRWTALSASLFSKAAFKVNQAAPDEALAGEAFSALQDASTSITGRALANSTARASLDPAGQALARAWQGAIEERAGIDRRRSEALASIQAPVTVFDGDDRRAALSRLIEDTQRELIQTQPRYMELIAPQPVPLQAVATGSSDEPALLGDDEALILLAPLDERMAQVAQKGLVFAVTRQGYAWAEISLERAALHSAVQALRSSLDSEGATPASGVDLAASSTLYAALFGDPAVAALIADKPEWILVPQGELVSLPFAALSTAKVSSPAVSGRPQAWLGLQRALSIVPEVATLRTLRTLKRPTAQTSTPFIGFGAPDFGGSAQPGQAAAYFRGSQADVDAVRKLAPLPGTAEELHRLAAAFGVDDVDSGALWLGADATEFQLMRLNAAGDLGRARVIAFATHGLLTGDLAGTLAEPALALSPPVAKTSSEAFADDGLLTASEASGLSLRADWVILSACNTAAGGGEVGEGLTGLARAFFYAGADTLLVSHWRVDDEAAARLTTRAVQISNTDPNGSRAQALRASMIELSQTPGFESPTYWAPLTLVGVDRLEGRSTARP
ncbi:CHAT domain-containing tetratricopeptide repeat protein [Brevundimonas sp. Leaf363]|uniref:CHAT domain-containing tetratricopeptide repeat protein n=1 Tax=Brevundimonas sp. Leaf363 TaxID=1736353 RepID=UPI00138EFB7F|nr:CHAT domain-containing tetratricopeptide repeat protein [Brevundimonas sp. Leaf363]